MFFKRLRSKIYDGDNIVNLSNIRYLPRWLVILIDLVLSVFSFSASFFILNQLDILVVQSISLYKICFLVVGVNLFFMIVFRTYSGIIRHSTFIDIFKILLSGISTVLVLVCINFVMYGFSRINIFSNTLIFTYFGLSFIVMFLLRLTVKEFFNFVKEFRRSSLKKRILVLGIDEESVALAKAIMGSASLPFQVVGFLTQRHDSNRAKLLGKKIVTRKKIQDNDKETLNIDGVLINKYKITKEEINEWVNLFLEKDLRILKAPSVQKLRENDTEVRIHHLQIEDLLNRKPIVIENEEVKKRHYHKNVLITGGAGSIGSEIVRQVAQLEPSLIVVLDQAETPLHDIELEMRNRFPEVNFKFILADISNENRLEIIFQRYQFSMVYHAAAYKHVPLIEENPHEAALVNVQGTKNLALLSSRYNINRFVMVSTDKAVNPTNVMGASKRASELFVQALQNQQGNMTKFITTRFGNVLGSNGSVIPIFRKQIENGGPVTVTHPDIVRYFMTISEACELVLEAGTMGHGGEIFVFDMGEPVKIVNLAKRMIKLSGLEPDVDIKIIYTGLRPGEKLYEELLSDGTKNLPTHHSKIMISKDEPMVFSEIDRLTNKLAEEAKKEQGVGVVRVLKEIVKEFKSNNSVFEELDDK